MGFNGFYWVSMGCTGFYWVLLGFHWVLLGFHGFPWVFPWVSMGFTRFYWVSMGFTGFYWVLLHLFFFRFPPNHHPRLFCAIESSCLECVRWNCLAALLKGISLLFYLSKDAFRDNGHSDGGRGGYFIYLFFLVSMFTWWLGGQHYLSRD